MIEDITFTKNAFIRYGQWCIDNAMDSIFYENTKHTFCFILMLYNKTMPILTDDDIKGIVLNNMRNALPLSQ